MPSRYKPLKKKKEETPAPKNEGRVPDWMQHIAATGLRVAGPALGSFAGGAAGAAAGGVGAVPGAVAGGALGGGISEAIAQKLEPGGLHRKVNPGRVVVSGALGAVPGTMAVRSGKVLASAGMGAAMGYAGTAGNKIADGVSTAEALNPTKWTPSEIAFGPVAGSVVGGALGRYTRPKGGPAPAPKPTYEVETTAQTGGSTLGGGKLSVKRGGGTVLTGAKSQPVEKVEVKHGAQGDYKPPLEAEPLSPRENVPVTGAPAEASGRVAKAVVKEEKEATKLAEKFEDTSAKRDANAQKAAEKVATTESKLAEKFEDASLKKDANAEKVSTKLEGEKTKLGEKFEDALIKKDTEADALAKVEAGKVGLKPGTPSVVERVTSKEGPTQTTKTTRYEAPVEDAPDGGAPSTDKPASNFSVDNPQVPPREHVAKTQYTNKALAKQHAEFYGGEAAGVDVEGLPGRTYRVVFKNDPLPAPNVPVPRLAGKSPTLNETLEGALNEVRGEPSTTGPQAAGPVTDQSVLQAQQAAQAEKAVADVTFAKNKVASDARNKLKLAPKTPDFEQPGLGKMTQDEIGSTISQGPAEMTDEALKKATTKPAGAKSGDQLRAEAIEAAKTGKPAPLYKTKLEAAGENYGKIKDAKAAGEAVPEEGRAIAGKAAQKENRSSIMEKVDPDSSDLTKLAPEQQDAKLAELVKQFKDQKGAISQDLMVRLGLGGAGAMAGAAAMPDDPFTGALLGFGVGAFAPSVARALIARVNGGGVSAGGVEQAAKKIEDYATTAFRMLPDWQRFSYLTSLPNLPMNMWVGPYGSAVMGAVEHWMAGDPRGLLALKALSPSNFMRRFSNEGIAAGKQAIYNSAERTEGELGKAGPAWFKRLTKYPGEMMTAGDHSARSILMDAGFTEAEARRITLTSEPELGIGRMVTGAKRGARTAGGKVSWLANMAVPFYKTATNQFEQGLMRTPALGILVQKFGRDMPDPIKVQLAQQVVSGSVGGASFLLGTQVPKEDSKYVIKFLNNFGGQYGLVMTAAFVAGQASVSDTNEVGAITEHAVQQLPMFDAKPLYDISNLLRAVTYGDRDLKTPSGIIPGLIDWRENPDGTPKEPFSLPNMGTGLLNQIQNGGEEPTQPQRVGKSRYKPIRRPK